MINCTLRVQRKIYIRIWHFAFLHPQSDMIRLKFDFNNKPNLFHRVVAILQKQDGTFVPTLPARQGVDVVLCSDERRYMISK